MKDRNGEYIEETGCSLNRISQSDKTTQSEKHRTATTSAEGETKKREDGSA